MPVGTMSVERALAATRGVFIGLLVAQLFFGAAAVWFVGHRSSSTDVDDQPWGLLIAAAAALVLFAVAGYLVRYQLYQRDRRDNGTVAPRGYLWGNVAMLVPMGLIGIAGLTIAVLSGDMYPALLITLAALFVQVINMPTGDPLEPGRYRKDQTPSSA